VNTSQLLRDVEVEPSMATMRGPYRARFILTPSVGTAYRDNHGRSSPLDCTSFRSCRAVLAHMH